MDYGILVGGCVYAVLLQDFFVKNIGKFYTYDFCGHITKILFDNFWKKELRF